MHSSLFEHCLLQCCWQVLVVYSSGEPYDPPLYRVRAYGQMEASGIEAVSEGFCA